MGSEKMISKLPDLWDASGKLIDFLLPPNSGLDLDKLGRDLQDPSSRRAKNLRHLKAALNNVQEVYGNEPYIQPSNAVRGILNVQYPSSIGEGPWRPDNIFYKANIATFVEGLQIPQIHSHTMQLPLDNMDCDFPKPFLARLVGISHLQTLGSSALLKDTFEVALDIRTQFTLKTLKDRQGDANFDPSIIINQIFYETDQTTSIREWGVDGLRVVDLRRKEKKNAIVQRMEQIQAHFKDDSEAVKSGSTVDIEALYAKFPPLDFVKKLLSWIRRRGDEIEKSLQDQGPTITDIQEKLDAEIRRREARTSKEEPAISNEVRPGTVQPSGITASKLSPNVTQDSTWRKSRRS